MVAQPARSETPFKDYYYALNLRPDAPVPEIEQAYWRLVRTGGSAEVGMDEVNEAYGVLTSPELRRRYDQLRNAFLGEGAPPQSLQPEDRPPRPPLMVMEKQQPRPRPKTNPAHRGRRLLKVDWRRVLSALGLVAAVIGATLIVAERLA